MRGHTLMQGVFGFVLGALFATLMITCISRPAAEGVKAVALNLPQSFIEDEQFLGPQTGDGIAKRRAGYVYKSNSYEKLYDNTWTQGGYPSQSCWGCRFAVDVIEKLKFHTVLDAGTGNGALTRLMRKHSKSAFGIELSRAVLEKECPDMLAKGYVEPGILTNLPYEDNSFDLVFSADVLEHTHPEEADLVISELIRVSRRHIFMSISLKGHNAAHLHTMLRPRHWWDAKFKEHGAVPNKEMLWAMQEKDSSFTSDQSKDCRWEGSESDGGLYEVCMMDKKWLVGRSEQGNLRPDRLITVANSELEPWFFVYRKLR